MDSLSLRYYEELCDLAYWQRSYDRAVQSGKYSTETCEVIFNLMTSEKYKKIAKQLAIGEYDFSIPEKRLIAKASSTKKRVIYLYAEIDRFIMSVLYRVSCVIFADLIPITCYSYKKGTNTSQAVQSIMSDKAQYGVKVDIHAYFNSVERGYLYKCLDELFPDKGGIKTTFDKIYRTDTIFEYGRKKSEYKSLIPGSALGSFFANYCLRDIDLHFEALEIRYARYSDDIILFDDTKEKVQEHIAYIKDELKKRGLTINPDKYTYFQPNEPVEFLGLKFEYTSREIDVSKHSKQKVKRLFKRWCDTAQKEVEVKGKEFTPEFQKVVKRFNWRLYKTFIEDTTRFGWAYYAFRYITTTKSLQELDNYCIDTLRAAKTGRHNSKNKYALTEAEIKQLGYVSFVEMYQLFKQDFGYYCDVVARI